MQDKNAALKAAGAIVPESFEGFEGIIKKTYDQLVQEGHIQPQPETDVKTVPLDLDAAKKAGKVIETELPFQICHVLMPWEGQCKAMCISVYWHRRATDAEVAMHSCGCNYTGHILIPNLHCHAYTLAEVQCKPVPSAPTCLPPYLQSPCAPPPPHLHPPAPPSPSPRPLYFQPDRMSMRACR